MFFHKLVSEKLYIFLPKFLLYVRELIMLHDHKASQICLFLHVHVSYVLHENRLSCILFTLLFLTHFSLFKNCFC